MKIVADENMPFVEALFVDMFDETVDVLRVDGRKLTQDQLIDAQVLLVRSVTQVNKALINDCKSLTFVGSATIGTDHVDQEYLGERGILFSSAPGCNATGVGEYAFIAALELAEREKVILKDKVVGIVGAGNTGMAAAKCFRAYGTKVLLCDPFKTQAELNLAYPPVHDTEIAFELVSLAELIAQADIISLHVPLTKEGEHKTWYLFDHAKLQSLKPDTWLFNCCRGEVIDNRALIDVKRRRADLKLVLDVWEGEPNPMAELVPLTEFATPHVAGYSLEGKARGTYALYQALATALNLPLKKTLSELLPAHFVSELKLNLTHHLIKPQELSHQSLSPQGLSQSELLTLARLVYDLRDDDRLFRKHVAEPSGFDLMRKNHTHRREFSALTLASSCGCEVNWLTRLGFSGVGH